MKRSNGWAVASSIAAVASFSAVVALIVDRGRLLLRLDELEAARDGKPTASDDPTAGLRAQSLQVGAFAPDVMLPDVEARERRLSDWRGRPVTVVFLDPQCGACPQLVEQIVDGFDAEPELKSEVILVTTGSPADVAELAGIVGDRCVVLRDPSRAAGKAFAVGATPSGYHLDADGRIDVPLAVGQEEILRVLMLPLEMQQVADASARNGSRTRGLRSVADSQVRRDGLRPGEAAPDFDLPRLGGGRMSLTDFRGQRTLLVFSDPACAPCQALAPHLERVHREQTDIAVAVVSRGEMDANIAKHKELGLTYPVAVQHHWRTSREFATFATPAGYLIDEQGEIRSPVAIGSERILALVAESIRTREMG